MLRPAAHLLDKLHHIHPAARSQQTVHLRYPRQHLLAVALRQAAGRDQHLVPPLSIGQLLQHTDRFLFGGFQKAASIHDQHIRLARIRAGANVRLLQQHLHAVTVNFVLWTSKRDQVIGLSILH